MKWILIFLFVFGCKEVNSPIVIEAGSTHQEDPSLKLNWGSEHQDWTNHLVKEISKSGLRADVKTPCKKVDYKTCLAQLISVMARYESGFKPGTQFKEGFNDSKGKAVISRGLLQLSIESANQKAYSCGITNPLELHNPAINLSCGVKIIVFQANKSGYLMSEPKKGCAAYWSVCRSSSKSNAKILSYLRGF